MSGSPSRTLFITGPEAASGTVEIPGPRLLAAVHVDARDRDRRLPLPDRQPTSASQEGIEAKGIHVTADQEVARLRPQPAKFTTDAYLGLPVDVLGTENIVLGIGTGLGGTSQLGVAASRGRDHGDDHPDGRRRRRSYGGRALQRHDEQGGCVPAPRGKPSQEDLSGSIVDADKPISVYGGHPCANVPDQTFVFCDYVVEQMPPTNTWGRTFGPCR